MAARAASRQFEADGGLSPPSGSPSFGLVDVRAPVRLGGVGGETSRWATSQSRRIYGGSCGREVRQ